jgi:hypothetical protein
MSTRAIYTFKGFGESHHVFNHYDGYPSGAAQWIEAALKLALGLPRYEPDEFAAAFVAANKHCPGGVRLAKSQTAFCDVEFAYVVEPDKTVPNLLKVTVYSVDFRDKPSRTKLWSGPLNTFFATAQQIEEKFYA